MVKKIYNSDIETTYVYSNVGMLCKKTIDIYNYYYENNEQCDKIDINGKALLIMIIRFQTRMFQSMPISIWIVYHILTDTPKKMCRVKTEPYHQNTPMENSIITSIYIYRKIKFLFAGLDRYNNKIYYQKEGLKI